jgi:hypothetical protein
MIGEIIIGVLCLIIATFFAGSFIIVITNVRKQGDKDRAKLEQERIDKAAMNKVTAEKISADKVIAGYKTALEKADAYKTSADRIINNKGSARLNWITNNKYHFYVDIGDNCHVLVTISAKTIQDHNANIEKVKNIISDVLIEMTKNVDVSIKKAIVGNTIPHVPQFSVQPEKGDYTVDMYNCDPNMGKKETWGNNNYEYLTDINGYNFLEDIIRPDTLNPTSDIYGLMIKPRVIMCIGDILCDNPGYNNQSVLVHEFAHLIMIIGIYIAKLEWIQEIYTLHNIYKQIGEKKTKDGDDDFCPGVYACDIVEFFAIVTQVWFQVISAEGEKYNRYLLNMEQIHDIRNDNISLYSFLEKVYGPPNNLCHILKRIPGCAGKCKNP